MGLGFPLVGLWIWFSLVWDTISSSLVVVIFLRFYLFCKQPHYMYFHLNRWLVPTVFIIHAIFTAFIKEFPSDHREENKKALSIEKARRRSLVEDYS
ncbi:hypothetical protein AAC978_07910 [Desulfitobacterium sp. THU1]|uniref:hypothetical protein n=1 Tax=Desulfitobacterium sp. THU1 TaxID=3138072 RepID=UPI00311FABBF